jgi:hypothetical protein
MQKETWPSMPSQDNISLEAMLEKSLNEMSVISKELRKGNSLINLPIDESLRINMRAFSSKHYSRERIEADTKRVEEAKKRQFEKAVEAIMNDPVRRRLAGPGVDKMAEKQIQMGKIWEVVATAVLHKNLGEDFMVVRTSEYDDCCNANAKVDTLILDKETGNIICVFDEIVTLSDKENDGRFKAKKKNIMESNLRGGAELEYGIRFKEGNGKRKLKVEKIANIPVFYLDITIAQFNELRANPGMRDKIFQEIIMKSIREQIEEIERARGESGVGEKEEIDRRLKQIRGKNPHSKNDGLMNQLIFCENFNYLKERFSNIFK